MASKRPNSPPWKMNKKKPIPGQISIIPKPEFFGDFGEVPLLNHHLGWLLGGKRRYNLPSSQKTYGLLLQPAKAQWTPPIAGSRCEFPQEKGGLWSGKTLPSLKLTFSPLKMDGWNTSFLLGWPIFRCYVSFRECTIWHFWVDDFPFPQVGYVIVPWRLNPYILNWVVCHPLNNNLNPNQGSSRIFRWFFGCIFRGEKKPFAQKKLPLPSGFLLGKCLTLAVFV